MSRSGYTDDGDNIAMWRGHVASAIRGKRGQAFLRELVEALDALPEKRLIEKRLIIVPADTYGPQTIREYYRYGGFEGYQRPTECGVCAIGAVGLKRAADMSDLDVDDYDRLADIFGIAHQLVQEIEYLNDEGWWYGHGPETPEDRWIRMRQWAVGQVREPKL